MSLYVLQDLQMDKEHIRLTKLKFKSFENLKFQLILHFASNLRDIM